MAVAEVNSYEALVELACPGPAGAVSIDDRYASPIGIAPWRLGDVLV